MDAPANPTTTALRYRVGGMDCPSCASTIETALRRLGGTDGVRLDFQSQTLALRLDEDATPRATIEARIRSLGFEIRPVAPMRVVGASDTADSVATDAEPAWWTTGRARLLLALATLMLGGLVVASAAPAVGKWAELPAALLGLGFFGAKAIRLAGAGTPFSIEMLMLSMAVRIRVNMAVGEKLARKLPLGHHGRRAGRQAPCQRRQPPKAVAEGQRLQGACRPGTLGTRETVPACLSATPAAGVADP